MRSGRQIELTQLFPMHVVCGWLGNSTTVAMTHYLQVRDEDYAKAITMSSTPSPTATASAAPPTAATVGEPAARNAA